MAYFLGRDVKVAITTEDASHGVNISSATPDIAQAVSDPSSGEAIDVLGATTFDDSTAYNPFTDVTSVDLTLGKVDEDIAYMGLRTALKAEIKNETTIVITKKQTSKFWDHVFMDARYGIGSDNALIEPNAQPDGNFGYRLHVQLQASAEVISIAHCQMTDKSTSLNVDGVTEETLTFISYCEPLIDTAATTSAVTAI